MKVKSQKNVFEKKRKTITKFTKKMQIIKQAKKSYW